MADETKKILFERALKKLNGLTRKELVKFLEMNMCPHENVSKCGMDGICNDCGDWV